MTFDSARWAISSDHMNAYQLDAGMPIQINSRFMVVFTGATNWRKMKYHTFQTVLRDVNDDGVKKLRIQVDKEVYDDAYISGTVVNIEASIAILGK